MSVHTPISSFLTPLLRSFRSLSLTTQSTTLLGSSIKSSRLPSITTSTNSNALPFSSQRSFSTSPALRKKNKAGKQKKTINDQRIALIRYHLQHSLTPRPLRFSRLRSLRHWTIHRAWMLARRKRLEKEEGELYRMHQSMHSACEALRTLDPPDSKDAGRLYRIAMEKKGTFGHGGVPIEYARLQVDTPGKEPWNHGWTR